MRKESNLTSRARELRQRMTDAERFLWNRLRRRFEEYRFRRQSPLGPFIVDFVCLRRKLVVEIDGGQHLENPRDSARDLWLVGQGYRVLRFWNHEVLKSPDAVLAVIADELGHQGEEI